MRKGLPEWETVARYYHCGSISGDAGSTQTRCNIEHYAARMETLMADYGANNR